MAPNPKEANVTKQKGPKRPKTEFTQKRIERKKTRHLSPAALAEYEAKKAAAKKPTHADKAKG
jgi:hypothetical protein